MNVPGDARFACRMNTDRLLEMQNIWSNANNVANIEDVEPTTWMEIEHNAFTWWHSPVQMWTWQSMNFVAVEIAERGKS